MEFALTPLGRLVVETGQEGSSFTDEAIIQAFGEGNGFGLLFEFADSCDAGGASMRSRRFLRICGNRSSKPRGRTASRLAARRVCGRSLQKLPETRAGDLLQSQRPEDVRLARCALEGPMPTSRQYRRLFRDFVAARRRSFLSSAPRVKNSALPANCFVQPPRFHGRA